MSKLQSPADYERELAEVERLMGLQQAFAEQHGLDFATELSLHSLESRRTELREEMQRIGDERIPQQEIAVIFDGRPVHDHTVDANFLSTMLRDLQRVVQNIVASAAGAQVAQVLSPRRFESEAHSDSQARLQDLSGCAWRRRHRNLIWMMLALSPKRSTRLCDLLIRMRRRPPC